jgi:hypothetical protein
MDPHSNILISSYPKCSVDTSLFLLVVIGKKSQYYENVSVRLNPLITALQNLNRPYHYATVIKRPSQALNTDYTGEQQNYTLQQT